MLKKLSEAIAIIKVVAAIIPLIRKLIAAVEIEGNGAEKKAAILQAAGQLIDNLPWEIGTGVKEGALKIIGLLVDIIIGVLNLVGHDWSKQTE
jgi:hypothetical protein